VHPHNSCREPVLTLPNMHIQLQAKWRIPKQNRLSWQQPHVLP
jgi:hypothetical protein